VVRAASKAVEATMVTRQGAAADVAPGVAVAWATAVAVAACGTTPATRKSRAPSRSMTAPSGQRERTRPSSSEPGSSAGQTSSRSVRRSPCGSTVAPSGSVLSRSPPGRRNLANMPPRPETIRCRAGIAVAATIPRPSITATGARTVVPIRSQCRNPPDSPRKFQMTSRPPERLSSDSDPVLRPNSRQLGSDIQQALRAGRAGMARERRSLSVPTGPASLGYVGRSRAGRSGRRPYAGATTFGFGFFLGRRLPKVPLKILPRLVRLSPLPIVNSPCWDPRNGLEKRRGDRMGGDPAPRSRYYRRSVGETARPSRRRCGRLRSGRRRNDRPDLTIPQCSPNSRAG
jgi:hypothetical protein